MRKRLELVSVLLFHLIVSRKVRLTEDERDAHGVSGSDVVGDVAEDDGDDCATADGGDEEGCAALGVATETAKRKSKYDRKDA
jgi:hypothetical protein